MPGAAARPLAGQAAGPGGNQSPGPARKKSIVRRSDDWPLDRIGVIEPVWRGRVVCCIATGPSLTLAQVEQVAARGLATVAVNDAYTYAPWADVCYFADGRWWNWHRNRPAFQAFGGFKVTIEENMGDLTEPERNDLNAEFDAGRVLLMRKAGAVRLSDDPRALALGSNSGYQAVNIATLGGARQILLLGYDMKVGPKGQAHYFGDHPGKAQTSVGGFTNYVNAFRRMAKETRARGIEIINCSPDTALDCFPKEPLEQAIARLVDDPAAAALPA